MSTAVALRHIRKRFGTLLAVDDASLEAQHGEIHALLGENGAGKTTLMNVLAGLYRPDHGSVELDGRAVEIHSPADAKRLGIGMVHQEQRLVGRFTAAENITLGHHQPRWIVLRRYLRELAARASEKFGLPIDAETAVWMLPMGRRQRVELVKLLHHGARLIILDEPTANLAPAEVDAFFAAIRQLSEAGRSVIFITHKLDEVLRFTDRVTIMRGGRVIDTLGRGSISREQLNQLMVGATEPIGGGQSITRGAAVLTLSGVTTTKLHRVDLDVHSGEVVAIAGVAGNGQTELVEAITGHAATLHGSITINGKDIRGLGARDLAELGAAHVPENRREVGLIGSQSVAVNLALRRYARPPLAHRGWLKHAAMRRAALELIERYGIQPPDPDIPVARLSGGNQQRVIIAREFAGRPSLIVADNFTRGLDPRSAQQFTSELFGQRALGAAILWITGDLGEALLCDRVAVMNRGRVAAVLPRAEASRERIGLFMSGDATAPAG